LEKKGVSSKNGNPIRYLEHAGKRIIEEGKRRVEKGPANRSICKEKIGKVPTKESLGERSCERRGGRELQNKRFLFPFFLPGERTGGSNPRLLNPFRD